MLSTRLASIVVVVAMVSLTRGCGSDVSSGDAGQASDAASERMWIEPLRSDLGVTGRSVLMCPMGACVILHFPPASGNDAVFGQFLNTLPVELEGEVKAVDDPKSRWCRPWLTHAPTSTFNCCTYAVGDVVGLNTGDWINPLSSPDTLYTTPMQVILDSYFKRVRTYGKPFGDLAQMESDALLQEGDVLCFVNTRGPVPVYIHAGKIAKSKGKNQLLSKLGVGPIVQSTLRVVASEYSDSSDEVWVFRSKRAAAHRARTS